MKNTDSMIWNADLYSRLSKDDRDKDESNSIKNQRDLLRDFVSGNPDICVYDELSDDGFTGANFERDAFRKMIRHIEEGKVNCVIVKDFSRLGRDHIETGKYIERYFAEKKVRFISINDHYDSLKADMSDSNNSLIVPFKNIINEAFLEDISTKTKSQLDIKRKNGEFVGNFAVYGYLKTADKKLVPDDYASGVVKGIFECKIGGYNEGQIASILNDKGILPPAAYKQAQGIKYHTPFSTQERPMWSAVAVKRILTNRVYTGCLEQGKRTKVSYRMTKFYYRPQEEWVVRENNHEPIVSEADFRVVQELLAKDTRVASGAERLHAFSGILICGGCGRPMILRTVKKRSRKYIYFICSTHKKHGTCKHNSIPDKAVEAFALASVRAQIASLITLADMDEGFARNTLQDRKQAAIEDMIGKNLRIIEEQKNYLVKAFEHFIGGSISEDEHKMFQTSFNRQIEGAENTIAALQAELVSLRDGARDLELVEQFRKYENITALDRAAVVNMIASITVQDSRNMSIRFRYMSEFDSLALHGGQDAERMVG